MTSPTSLVFVYNADSGLFNTLTDIAHKVFSPDTYACQLCALTHGHFSMREEWKGFIESLGVPCEFMHRDEYEQRHGKRDFRPPVVFRRTPDGMELCLSAEAIEACAHMDALKQALRERCLHSGG